MSQSYTVPVFEEYSQEEEIAATRNINRNTNVRQEIADDIQIEKDQNREDIQRDKKFERAMNLMLAMNAKISELVDIMGEVDPDTIELLYDHINDIYVDDGNPMDLLNIEFIDAFRKL